LKVYNLTFDGSLNHTYKPAFVSRETHDGELLRSQVVAGDVLINIVGPPLGQVSLLPAAMAEANINQAIARFRPVSPLSS
jgi:type I restriction enzyme S subunit